MEKTLNLTKSQIDLNPKWTISRIEQTNKSKKFLFGQNP